MSMRNKTLTALFGTLCLTTLLALPMVAFGANAIDSPEDLGLQYADATGLTSTDIRTTVANIINVALTLLGIIALVIIVFAGFKWMTAGGNDDQIGEARKMMVAGVVGLAIILSAYAIAKFVIESLLNATQ
ncbi:MAG: pilin [Patescibacteria group bacterium]